LKAPSSSYSTNIGIRLKKASALVYWIRAAGPIAGCCGACVVLVG
jgi:hypothetical protein